MVLSTGLLFNQPAASVPGVYVRREIHILVLNH